MARHAALYCRLSKDRGRAASPRALTRRNDGAVTTPPRRGPDLPAVVYADQLTSAPPTGTCTGPGYEALRQAIGRGEVAHVWCVEQSRLERREVGWFMLAAELVAAGITELHTNRDGIVRVGRRHRRDQGRAECGRDSQAEGPDQ